jgi:fatty acid desaturase
MTVDALDRLLTEAEPLTPTPRFTASVMAAVRAEAATTQPLPFPWQPALAGLAACLPIAAAACWMAIGSAASGGLSGAPPTFPPGFTWAVASLAGCFALVSTILRRADAGALSGLSA